MARARREWSSLRTDIRRLIQDEDTTSPHFSDADLLALFNECKDHREMRLFGHHEGYGIFRYNDNLEAGRQEYPLPEEAGRIKTVFIVDSGGDRKRAIHQDRQFAGTYQGDNTQSGYRNFTYSLKDNHLFLYPCPSESVTNGIQYEVEAVSDRIANNSDKLPDSWPGFVETLLVLDTAIAALEMQATEEGDLGTSQLESISRRRRRYEEDFDSYTASRTSSYVTSPGFDLGA